MKRLFLGVLLVTACGGSGDVAIPDATTGGDTGGGGNDGGGGGDTGMTNDTGTGNDGGGGMDSGGGNDGGGNDGGGFNIGNVSCLVLWLDAAKGVTQNQTFVSAWADQSGKSNNAAQAIMARQPSLVMTGINNLPSLHFASGQVNGNMLLVADSATMQWGTGDFAVWEVARYDNNVLGGFTTGNAELFTKSAQINGNQVGAFLQGNFFNGQGYTAGLAGGLGVNNVLTQTQGYNDGKARAYGVRRSGTTIELRVNGQAVQTAMQNGNVDISNPQVSVRIGADGDASQRRMNGDIAEIIGCKGSISGSDLANVDAYLKSKYNL